jgi:hypothetical protein
VSGRSDRSLLGLTRGALESPDAERLARIPGLVPAIVTDNNDPDGLGRVLLRFPWLGPKADTPAVSPWAPVVQFGAGNGRGAMFIPEVDDEVLVGFDHGNVDHPYVLGGLYNGVDLPPLQDDLIDGSDGKVVIESTGDLELTAEGSLQLSGSAGVKIESSATVEVSGSMIKLN